MTVAIANGGPARLHVPVAHGIGDATVWIGGGIVIFTAVVLVATAAALRARRSAAVDRADVRGHLQAIMTGQERERRRWARELHDDTLQDLAALRLVIATAARSDDPVRHRRALAEAATHIDEQIANLRYLITELRPPLLDDVGLRAALEALRARIEARHDLTVNLGIFSMPPARTLGPLVVEAVYRLVQEALSNAVKHSRAHRVQVSVTGHPDALAVEIEDDGVGFDQVIVSDGFGLVSMRERATALDGRLDVLSAPGLGTRISARIPTAPRTGGLHDVVTGVRGRPRRRPPARYRHADEGGLINPWETFPEPSAVRAETGRRHRRRRVSVAGSLVLMPLVPVAPRPLDGPGGRRST